MGICGWELAPAAWWLGLADGTRAEWSAAIATTGAVVVALWAAHHQVRLLNRERSAREAAAARLFGLAMIQAENALPKVLDYWKSSKGQNIAMPGSDYLYGLPACDEIILAAPHAERLPFELMDTASMVIFQARSWKSYIETVRNTATDPKLTEVFKALSAPSETVEKQGRSLGRNARSMREACNLVAESYDRRRSLFRWYVLGGRKKWLRMTPYGDGSGAPHE